MGVIYYLMYLNCRQIIVSSIKISQHLFADYLDEFRLVLENNVPNFLSAELLRVVPEESFVE